MTSQKEITYNETQLCLPTTRAKTRAHHDRLYVHTGPTQKPPTHYSTQKATSGGADIPTIANKNPRSTTQKQIVQVYLSIRDVQVRIIDLDRYAEVVDQRQRFMFSAFFGPFGRRGGTTPDNT